MAEHGIVITLTDNSPQVLAALENAKRRGLEAVGDDCEGWAKELCPYDTGRLRNSINHSLVGDNEVDIGTDCEYAPYVEFGTGCYSTQGGGTGRDSWVYYGDDGEFHRGYPQPAREFIKPCVADHTSQIMDKLRDSFQNA